MFSDTSLHISLFYKRKNNININIDKWIHFFVAVTLWHHCFIVQLSVCNGFGG